MELMLFAPARTFAWDDWREDMSSAAHPRWHSLIALAAVAIVVAAVLHAPAPSFAADAPMGGGGAPTVKSSGAACAEAVRFVQGLRAGGAFSDWRRAAVSQSVAVQGLDGQVAVYVVTLSTVDGYAGYVTIDAKPSAQPVLEFSRNPAPAFASLSVAQTSMAAVKRGPQVRRQVYLGPLSYAVETVLPTTGATETVPTGAIMRPSKAEPIRGPPVATASFSTAAFGTSYRTIANVPDLDQFTYDYTSSEYNAGTLPAAAGLYGSPPYLNAGSYYCGCSPTAASDVLEYWAENGYPNLLTGGVPLKGGASWQKLVNDVHVCFRTFESSGGGATYSNEVVPGMIAYARDIGGYTFSGNRTSAFAWESFTAQIDANRPVVLMFQNLDVTYPDRFAYGDHAVTGVGYDYTPGSTSSEYLIIHDNWPAAPSDVYVQFSGVNATYTAREMVTFGPSVSPANDAFAAAQALSGPSGTAAGANLGATKQTGEPNHAGNAGGESVWYRWTAPSSGALTVDTFGSGLDTLLASYTGTSVSALTGVASNDDFAGHGSQSQITFPVVAGTTYRIAVDGHSGASGTVSLHWAYSAPAEPDSVTATIGSVGPDPAVFGTTVTFSGSAGDSLGHVVTAYEWTSSIDGLLSSAASFSTPSLSEGVHTVSFRAMCADGTWSPLRTTVVTVTGLPDGPANDRFDAAQPLSDATGTVAGTTVGGTTEADEPAHMSYVYTSSIWYVWTAPANGVLTLDAAGVGFDPALAVYSGSGITSLSPVAADNPAGGDATVRVTPRVVAGTTYRIAVTDFDGKGGDVTLSWAFTVPVPTASTVHLNDGSISRYHYVTITGTLKPAVSGKPVRVEILKPGSHTWIRLVTRTTTVGGTWASYRYKARIRGTYHVRTRFLGDTQYDASKSAYAHLRVR